MAYRWENKWKWNTGYSADSVEWCPVENYNNVLVCGTYQLEKKDEQETTKQKRLGRIYLFIINESTKELNPIQTIDTSGVLDQKWCYHTIEGHPVLAVVTSEGNVEIYQLIDDCGNVLLKLWIQHTIAENLLALSIDWSTNKIANDTCLVVSDSSGQINILKIVGNDLENIGKWNAHGFEAWIAAFNYWNPNLFYSGGDDCIFKSFDIRLPDMPVTTNKSHEAGVTAIRSSLDVEHQLLTGSYDEKVRVWDARKLKNCITETDVKGGVWRLKYHPYKSDIIVAACMYGGFRILSVNSDINILSEYLEHESIAYGADWKFDEDSSVVATCSFYDCVLHIGEIVL